ncbi:hypothetical protein EVAR_100950_1 [Eumeta japonica]|uniref:Uncharacterized protein n=1 Tax=Eumeta variegata TaxID=151549 RepID=A0A4C1SFU3_EUMVA|nr:hypothetical protein EVAR_100950_1 [Eumeta japonica]
MTEYGITNARVRSNGVFAGKPAVRRKAVSRRRGGAGSRARPTTGARTGRRADRVSRPLTATATRGGDVTDNRTISKDSNRSAPYC